MRKRRDIANRAAIQPTRDQVKFMERRVAPFMDQYAMSSLSIQHLLCETYMQGIRDATEVLRTPTDSGAE